jgi:hypothetical protein
MGLWNSLLRNERAGLFSAKLFSLQLKLSRPLIALLCAALAFLIFLINPFGVKPEAAKVIGFAVLMICG